MSTKTTYVGAYQIVRPLGEGGMGAVYQAIPPGARPNEYVAIKILKSAKDLKRHAREVAVLRGIGHRNIIECLGHGPDYLVMPLLDGTPLATFLDHNGELTREEALEIGAQICDAADALHELGILHRDLNPGNIVLVPRPEGGWDVIVIDFGIVKILNDDEELTNPGIDLKATKVVMGTPAYMSPEQAGGEKLGPSSDIYQIGLILVRILTKASHYADGIDEDVLKLMATMQGAKPLDPALEQTLDRGTWKLLNQLLAKDPEQRPSAADASRYLRALIQGVDLLPDPVQAAEEHTPEPPPVPKERAVEPESEVAADEPHSHHPLWLVACGLLAGIMVTSIALMLWERPWERNVVQTAASIEPPLPPLPRETPSPQVIAVTPPAETTATASSEPIPTRCASERGWSFDQGLRVGRVRIPDRGCWERAPTKRRKRCQRIAREHHLEDPLARDFCRNIR